jgi:endoglucanase
MKDTLKHLKNMLTVSGLSGYEGPIREVIEEVWAPLTDEISVSKLGSLHACLYGDGPEPRKSIMIATHMDAIGLMVTSIQEEFLHITSIGGIDPRVLPGQIVSVHGTEEIPGMIIQPPAHTLPEDAQKGPVPIKHLLVDTGLSAREVKNKIKIGDLVSFGTEPIELDGSYIVGHTLDNRASVAVMSKTLELLKRRKHEWDVIAVATTQEEETLGGAATSGYAIRPTIAVVVDVTFAKTPGSAAHLTFEMDKGPTFDWGPNTHPQLFKAFEKFAKENEYPHQHSVYSKGSGTDAMTLQLAGEGIPMMIIGIPLRYMHTPVEMIQVKDVERTARLLADFISNLDDEFMENLKWDAEKEEDEA